MNKIEIPDEFKYIVLSQRGFDSESPLVELLSNFQREASLLDENTPPAATRFLDVGSGVGFASLLLNKMRPDKKTNFYLFDKSTITENLEKIEFRKKHHFFYNDFNCTRKIIDDLNIPKESFLFIDAEPENLLQLPKMDVIFSFFSWGWHYHVNTYAKELQKISRPGTTVIADIRVDEVADYDAQKNLLSECFNSEPETLKTYTGWKKSNALDPLVAQYVKNNTSDYGQTKGNKPGPKGHRFKWVVK